MTRPLGARHAEPGVTPCSSKQWNATLFPDASSRFGPTSIHAESNPYPSADEIYYFNNTTFRHPGARALARSLARASARVRHPAAYTYANAHVRSRSGEIRASRPAAVFSNFHSAPVRQAGTISSIRVKLYSRLFASDRVPHGQPAKRKSGTSVATCSLSERKVGLLI